MEMQQLSRRESKSTFYLNLEDEQEEVVDDSQSSMCSCSVIEVGNNYKNVWDLLILLLVVYCTVSVPFQVCFESQSTKEEEGFWLVLELFMEAVFLIDMGLTLNSAYVDDDNVTIYDRRKIARRYLTGWFWIDCPASIPVGWILLFFPVENSSTLQLPKLMRMLRLMRLLRLLRLLKMSTIFQNLEDHFELNANLMKIFKMFLVLLALGHFIACGWFMVAVQEPDFSQTWVGALEDGRWGEGVAEMEDLYTIYVYALYWALTTISTVGYGDISPLTNSERIFTMATYLLGACVFGYMMGNIASAIASMDHAAEVFNTRMDSVKEYLVYRNFPPTLGKKVKKYYNYYWTRRSVFDEQDIINHLTPGLRTEVRRFLHFNSLGHVSVFNGIDDDDFLMVISDKLKPTFAVAGDTLLVKGEEVREICLIMKGQVLIMDAVVKRALIILQNGDYFGEEMMSGARAKYTVVAGTPCDMQSLGGHDLEEVFKEFPHAAKIMGQSLLKEACNKQLVCLMGLRVILTLVATVATQDKHELHARAALRIQLGWREVKLRELTRQLNQFHSAGNNHALKLDMEEPSMTGLSKRLTALEGVFTAHKTQTEKTLATILSTLQDIKAQGNNTKKGK